MNYEQLLYSVLFGLASFVYYKIFRWWINGKVEKATAYNPLDKLRKVKGWVIIACLALTSIVYLLKAI